MSLLKILSPTAALIVASACASARASAPPPASGAVAAALDTVPSARLPITSPRKIGFKWEFEGDQMVARGDGVFRIAPPDSTRVDFFLAGGFGAGAAILVGDTLNLPPGAMSGAVKDMLPPTQFLWETLKKVVTRDPAQKVFNVNYGSPFDRRKLKLIITNDEISEPYNQSIWRF